MWLTRVSINNPVFAAMIMLALMVIGLLATFRMKVEEFPNIEFPFVVVNTVYSGASPEVIETDITKKIEDQVNTIAGVKEVTSVTQQGLSQVIVQFDLNIPSDVAAQNVRDKLALVTPTFRDEVTTPIVAQYNPADAPVVSVTFRSDKMSLRELSTYLDNTVKKQLQTVTGVGRVDILGGRQRQIRVLLNPTQMNAYKVSVNQISNALRSENVELPVGTINNQNQEMVIQVNGLVKTPNEFNQIIVAQNRSSTGAIVPVYLSQVAQVVDGQAEAESASLQNGQPAVAMDIIKMSDANVIDVVDKTQQRLAEIQATLPPGVTMTVVADSSKSIRGSLNNVVRTLIEGAILAVFIVWLFLGSWRSTIITGLTLPISLLGTLAAIWTFGFSINMMTLLALALCIGLLIDDAIVVRENIVRHVGMGKHHRQAALDGTQEIGLAVLATTLVIVAVFLPVAFMGGIIGRFFYQFGVTVSTAVLLSLFVSFTLDPMLSSIWPDPDAVHQHDRVNERVSFRKRPIAWLLDGFQRLLDRLTNLYSHILAWNLRHRLITMLIAIGSLVAAFFAVGLVGKEFVPQADMNEIKVKFETPVNANLDYTQQKAAQINAVLQSFPEVTNTYATVNAMSYSGNNRVQVNVSLVPKDERTRGLDALNRAMREQLQQVGGIKVTSVAAAAMAVSGGLKPIMISIKGNDLTELQRLSNEFMQKLSNVNGLVDLESTLKQPKSMVNVTINREAANDAGLSIGQIGQALRPLLAGDNVSTFKDDNGNNIDVNVRLNDDNRQTISQLQSMYLSSSRMDSNGQPILIPLSQVANFSETLGAPQINRRSLFREVVVQANTDGRPAGDIGADITNIQNEMKLPPGYSFAVQGSNKDMAESIGYATTALGLAIVFIYMLLGSQFNSFLYPVAIMASLPLSLIGVFFALFLFGSSLNMFSIIGIIMLMGLVCKNAILLIDFIKESLSNGLSRTESIMLAGQTRLRPILMTTAAMVMGMVPLALGIGEGSEQQAPMAHAIIGGVITSTLLTLIVVPVIYTYLDDGKQRFFRLFAKKKTKTLAIEHHDAL
ncbi:MAG: efflux RND transporter permease subunit [Moraxella sp.]|jgi:HAE1 family hydrophobic/amphiphilic exporter-1|nr:efflux RND transporter permease subunit [Moraxella osloensis]MBP6341187.1 efflux RND transporter permease subunit [Moraxella sp.]MBP6485285.1 efflux RND transporter permease subunit [Moraxella sp.]MBP7234066.1 efflux RND transporter permease subunit [Moraxella sp.]